MTSSRSAPSRKRTGGESRRHRARALGSTRRKLRHDDLPAVLETLSARRVSVCFVIGGNDSAETGHTLGLAAGTAGYELHVVNVPKTIDNDLVLTDHTPGYGSAARFRGAGDYGRGPGTPRPWARRRR